MAFEAFPLSRQGLEKVLRAWSTWSKTSFRIESRLAFFSAHINSVCSRLEGEEVIRTSNAFFVTIKWRFTSIAIFGTFQTRY